jgi:hypothetical protein
MYPLVATILNTGRLSPRALSGFVGKDLVKDVGEEAVTNLVSTAEAAPTLKVDVRPTSNAFDRAIANGIGVMQQVRADDLATKAPIRSDVERLNFYMDASGNGENPSSAFIHGTYNPNYTGAAMNAGALKGPGYLGDVGGKGTMVTEYASGIPAKYLSKNTNSEYPIEAPVIVPTLSRDELSLASMNAQGWNPPKVANREDFVPFVEGQYKKSQKFAKERLANGLPPYYHMY